jgi:uncharacterized membrane protein YoaK (UPF0700 family)
MACWSKQHSSFSQPHFLSKPKTPRCSIAMGLRTAVVRKLGVADLTTTVLTLTIAGLAADSALAGDSNPRWRRRLSGIACMLAGAAAGAALLRFSLTVPLLVCGVIAMVCALTTFRRTDP